MAEAEIVGESGQVRQGMFLLLYFSVLTGCVAAIGPLVFLAAVGLYSGTHLAPISLLFGPAFIAAAIVTTFLGAPAFAAVSALGLRSRWWYAGAMLLIVGACYFGLFGARARGNVFFHPVETLSVLVPIAAIPSGFFFHWLVHRTRSVPSINYADVLLYATGICVWIFVLSTISHTPRGAPDPLHTRDEIVRLAAVYGAGAFAFGAFIASLIRLWSVRFASLAAALSWLVPIYFVAAFYLTPTGPGILTFTAGGRTFNVDWRLDPRSENEGFSFESAGGGPYEIAGGHQVNRRLYISDASQTVLTSQGLVAGWPPPSPEARLACRTAEQNSAGIERVCAVSDAGGRIAVLIECRRGYCVFRFDDHALRYRFLIDAGDMGNWNSIRGRAISLLGMIDDLHPAMKIQR